MLEQNYVDFVFWIWAFCFLFVVMRYGRFMMYWIAKIMDGGHGEKESREEYLQRTGMPNSFFLPFMVFSFFSAMFSLIVVVAILATITTVGVLSFVELTAISLDLISYEELPNWAVAHWLDEPLLIMPFFLAGLAIVTLTYSTIFSVIDSWLTGTKTKPVRLEEKQIKALRFFLENMEDVVGGDDDSDASTPMEDEEE